MQVMATSRSRGQQIAVALLIAVTLLLASALLAGTSTSTSSASATSTSSASAARVAAPGSHPASHAKTRYARIRHACRRPTPKHPECLALGRVTVAPGTVGARPFVQNDGATESGPAGGLTPAQLASAYEYDPAEGGAAQVTTGLTSNTEYHFRITVTNAAGSSRGEDVTFKTS